MQQSYQARTSVLSLGFLRMHCSTWYMGAMPVPPASMPAAAGAGGGERGRGKERRLHRAVCVTRSCAAKRAVKTKRQKKDSALPGQLALSRLMLQQTTLGLASGKELCLARVCGSMEAAPRQPLGRSTGAHYRAPTAS